MNLKDFYFKNNYAVVRNLPNPLPLRNLPQLYVEGEVVGGCDIVKEMFEKGDLKKFLEKKSLLS